MPAERFGKSSKGAPVKEPAENVALVCIEDTKKGLFLRIRVQPGASKNSVDGMHGGSLKIRISAPPVEGAANRAAVEFLSGILKVKKSGIEITSGLSSRDKRVKIDGISAATLGAIILKHLDRPTNETE